MNTNMEERTNSSDENFKAWKKRMNKEFSAQFMVSLDDLVDIDYYNLWQDDAELEHVIDELEDRDDLFSHFRQQGL